MLAALFGGGDRGGGAFGIGDDAALVPGAAESFVWTVDAAVEGVHFDTTKMALEDIGYRATMAAASDLAAMGADPRGVLSALVLPKGFDDDALLALAKGQRAAADSLEIAVLGGNLARGGELSITTTVLGVTPRALLRSGARVGDTLWLAGEVGYAAAGLALVLRGEGAEGPDADAKRRAKTAFLRPLAHIREGQLARPYASAAIDLSDGLACDAGQLAEASGLRVVLFEGAIVDDGLRRLARVVERDALALALHGGEDYALLVAAPARAPLAGFRPIGTCVARAPGEGAVAVANEAGDVRAITAAGFDHFARG